MDPRLILGIVSVGHATSLYETSSFGFFFLCWEEFLAIYGT